MSYHSFNESTMSADAPCHSEPSLKEASINQMSHGGYSLKMDEDGSSQTIVTVDTLQFSDKVPLTEFHLCKTADCHNGNKVAHSESPLEPMKTRALYIILLLLASWVTFYVLLVHFNIL